MKTRSGMQAIAEVENGYSAVGSFAAPDGSIFYRTKTLTVDEFERLRETTTDVDFGVNSQEGTAFPGVILIDGVSTPCRLLQSGGS